MVINTFNEYLKKRFGHKVYKISLNAGMTCPNRDGTIGTRGCIFCSEGGSGDFEASKHLSITEQIFESISLMENKIHSDIKACYIAYFQAYTNTYAPPDELERIYTEAAYNENICAISIATRPDCMNEDIAELLYKIHQIKPVFIEFGLQTSNEASAEYIRRGYKNDVFAHAVSLIDSLNRRMNLPDNHIHIIVHTIIGLPGESYEDMENTIKYVNRFPVHGIKLQLLHVLKNTDLSVAYEKKQFQVLSMEEYADILIKLLLHIRPDIVIHRMTGDGPKKILIAPMWSGDKKRVLNYINQRIADTPSDQGSLYQSEE